MLLKKCFFSKLVRLLSNLFYLQAQPFCVIQWYPGYPGYLFYLFYLFPHIVVSQACLYFASEFRTLPFTSNLCSTASFRCSAYDVNEILFVLCLSCVQDIDKDLLDLTSNEAMEMCLCLGQTGSSEYCTGHIEDEQCRVLANHIRCTGILL